MNQLTQAQYSLAYNLDADVGVLAFSLIWWLHYFGANTVITEATRSPARQASLYASGRTKPGPILTNTLTSRHMAGRAFDIDFIGIPADRVHPLWWEFAGLVGEALGLRWGGRWPSLVDQRHFER